MKKFAFLLALVAVLAMSACAFADEPGVNGAPERNAVITDGTAVNMGAISPLVGGDPNKYGATVYVLKEASADVNISISVDVLSADVAGKYAKVSADMSELNAESFTWVSTDITAQTKGEAEWVSVDITIKSLDVAKTDVISIDAIGMYNDSSISDDARSVDLTLNVKKITLGEETLYSVKEGTLVATVDITNTQGIAVTAGLSVDKMPVSADVKVDGSKLVISPDATVKSDDVITIDLVAKDESRLTVDEGGEFVHVATPEGKSIDKGQKIFTVTITVTEDPNKKLAEAVKAAVTEAADGFTLGTYAPGAAVDKNDAVTKDAYRAAISADLKVSADVQMVSEVNVVVPEGGYTVIASKDVAKMDYIVPAGLQLEFAKVFINGSDRQIERLYTGTSGDKSFKYNLVVIDGEAPPKLALVTNKKSLETMGKYLKGDTLYVWDGVKDKKAVDPIIAARTAAGSKSSSSTCDVGFGLAALAGLAVLALRKRSK